MGRGVLFTFVKLRPGDTISSSAGSLITQACGKDGNVLKVFDSRRSAVFNF